MNQRSNDSPTTDDNRESNGSEPELRNAPQSSNRRRFWWIGAVVACLFLAALAWFLLSPVRHTSVASAQREFLIECDFARFRQLMVRKSPTQAIVAHGGMKLIHETIHDIKMDTTKDDRPILNAIRGRSKVELNAERTLTVELNDPQIETEQLTLSQIADIDADKLAVRTTSIGEQKNVKKYETTLNASSNDKQTRIRLTIDMSIEIQVPRFATSIADRRIQKAAENGLVDQQGGITQFVIDHADESLILPDLKSAP
jgi:hypothetical protein